MIVATVGLSRRWNPARWGGTMRSAPGGRRCRQTLTEPMEGEIAREARRWWEERVPRARGLAARPPHPRRGVDWRPEVLTVVNMA